MCATRFSEKALLDVEMENASTVHAHDTLESICWSEIVLSVLTFENIFN